MTKKIFRLLLLLVIFSQCKTKTKTSIEERKYNNLTKKHCYIKKVLHENDSYSIVIDDIKFLFGDEAFKAAKINNDLDFEVRKAGDTSFFLYNNYYVSNQSDKLTSMKLNSSVDIQLWNYPKQNNKYNKATITQLIDYLQSEPIIILTVENGLVSKIMEQYIP